MAAGRREPPTAQGATFIDLSLLTSSGETAGDEHRRLLAACVDDGFFRLTGTGVDAAIPDVYAQSRRFHDLGDEAKADLHNDLHRGRGWVPLLNEPAYEPGTVARCESFDLAYETAVADNGDARGGLGPNVWPDPSVLPDFQQTVYGFYQALRQVGRQLFRALSVALGLSPDRLGRLDTARSPSMMRLLHYPDRSIDEASVSSDGRAIVGISTHTDYEVATLMHQDGPGLQLRRPDGSWIDAPVNGTGLGTTDFTVIVGDMLERISNGRLTATPHRVPDTATERSSIVLFCAVDADTEVGPFDEFVTADRPARYETTTQATHLADEVGAAIDNRDRMGRTVGDG